jgi:hypothetical protein
MAVSMPLSNTELIREKVGRSDGGGASGGREVLWTGGGLSW